jgi:hypothetical protein
MAALEAHGDLQALADGSPLPSVVLHDDTWHPGLVGLVASRIKERTEGAVICFAPEGDPSEGGPVSDTLKGSGRSANVHLRDTLALVATWAPDMGMRFGGHARAAGLSLDRAHLPCFRELFERAVAHQIQVSPLTNPDWHDGYLSAGLRTMTLAQWIELQPWGQMFPEPVFEGRFVVEHMLPMRERHLKLRVRDREDDDATTFELVWFFFLTPGQPAPIEVGDAIDVDYTLSVNRWNGSERLQGIVRRWTSERPTAVATQPVSQSRTQPVTQQAVQSTPSHTPLSESEPSTEPVPSEQVLGQGRAPQPSVVPESPTPVERSAPGVFGHAAATGIEEAKASGEAERSGASAVAPSREDRVSGIGKPPEPGGAYGHTG